MRSQSQTRLELLHSLQDRLNTERALQRAESRYEAQFQLNPIPTYVWQLRDTGLVLADYNDAALVSTDGAADKAMGATAKVTFEVDYPAVLEALLKCLRNQESVFMEIECSFLGKDRSCERWFHACFIFIPPDSVMVLTEDITDKREAAAEREKLDSLKDEFIANVSHELRTPLALILGYTSLLADGTFGQPPDEMKSALGLVQSKAEFMTHLLNTYLLIFKLDHIEATILDNFTDFDMGKLIAEVGRDFSLLANQAGLEFRLGKVGSSMIQGNKDWLRLVCNNLLSNAIKFTDCGWISISTWQTDGNCIIEVADSGIGIPQGDLSNVFMRFYQVDGSNTRERGGSGLGLAVVESVIRLHGGQVSVRSKLGEGSTFRLALPIK